MDPQVPRWTILESSLTDPLIDPIPSEINVLSFARIHLRHVIDNVKLRILYIKREILNKINHDALLILKYPHTIVCNTFPVLPLHRNLTPLFIYQVTLLDSNGLDGRLLLTNEFSLTS